MQDALDEATDSWGVKVRVGVGVGVGVGVSFSKLKFPHF